MAFLVNNIIASPKHYSISRNSSQDSSICL